MPDEWCNEFCVLITLTLNGMTTRALIDSGGEPSIIDMKSFADIGANYEHSQTGFREYVHCPQLGKLQCSL